MKNMLRRLKQGVAKWNAWRNQFPLAGADLSSADLSSADLSHADLSGADLSHADLSGANLSSADLSHADLSRADLSGADLSRADLSGAVLNRADLNDVYLNSAYLVGADLNGAYLVGADLIGANLRGTNLHRTVLAGANMTEAILDSANLSGAWLLHTVFGDVDLSGVIGLEACEHNGPSIIDFRTLEKSKSLPLTFLRGVGLPETVIDYLPSLLNQPIQYYSCFISYSAKDEDFAKRIHADLQSKGVRCWFAPHDMPIGGKILDEIDESIRLRDKLLLILSSRSIKSEWVEDEVTTAFEEERKRGEPVLFPIRLDNSVLTTDEPWAAKLRDRNIGDFRGWKEHENYQGALKRVLRDLTQARANGLHE